MRKFGYILASYLLFSLLFLTLQSPAKAQDTPSEPTSQILVKFKKGQSPRQIEALVEERAEKFGTPILGPILKAINDRSIRREGNDLPENVKDRFDRLKDDTQTTEIRDIVTLEDRTISAVTTDNPDTQGVLQVFRSFPEVEIAQPNYRITAYEIPNDTYYSDQWGMRAIGMEEAWDIEKGSNDTIVAVIDTGVHYNHIDMPDNIIKGVDAIGGDMDPNDGHGHGTHVAGIIGAATNNALGLAGVNWNVRIMAIRVLDNGGGGSTESLLEGMEYAIANGANVINLSLGQNIPCSLDPLVQDVINQARAQDITVVVAAGNSSTDASTHSPASCEGVISVGALDQASNRASFSNYGSKVDISAPGVGIWSIWLGSQRARVDGTSQATPHVAGVAALLLSKNPSLTPDEIEQILKSTGDTIPDSSMVGNRLNAPRALEEAGSPPEVPSPTMTDAPSPTDSPPSEFTCDNDGSGEITTADYDVWLEEIRGSGGTESDCDGEAGVTIYDYIKWLFEFRISSTP